MIGLLNLWERLRSSLWFVPTIIVTCSVLLAMGLIELETVVDREQLVESWPRLFGAGAEGSRGLLSTIASSMITVAGVTFSITVVALALAASQFTSRVVGNFMRDRANQTVLGVFLGVFAYCLVVLRTIRGGNDGLFVPSLAVLVALLLALVAVAYLIFFIHHVAASIQAASIIETTASETLSTVERLFPKAAEAECPGMMRGDDGAGRDWVVVPAAVTGYVQSVDFDALVRVASSHDGVVQMHCGVGEFVIEGSPLLSVTEPSAAAAGSKLTACLRFGRQRTIHQDCGYGMRQLVDVALRALSAGINDTNTAINCVDYLGAILARIAGRRTQPRLWHEQGKLRLIAEVPSFSGLLAEAFDPIRQSAGSNVAVLRRLLRVLQTVAKRTTDAERHRAVAEQAAYLLATAECSVPEPHERDSLRRDASAVLDLCR